MTYAEIKKKTQNNNNPQPTKSKPKSKPNNFSKKPILLIDVKSHNGSISSLDHYWVPLHSFSIGGATFYLGESFPSFCPYHHVLQKLSSLRLEV